MPFHVSLCLQPAASIPTKHFLETMLDDSCFQEEVCDQGRNLYLDSK